MLTSREIRQQFIEFFAKQHGHTFVPSSPVVPHDDPTLLFTNAGMNQFKPYFLGTAQAPYRRAANTQKCIRAGGKHNDLDDVGRSRRHHTFFEMLGNWSFGDYFKPGAIEMAWELLTKVWKLDPTRLHVSCFEGDEKNGVPRDTEAADIWRRVANWEQYGHRSDDHIHYFGKDNFWEMGDTGPCGPCTEIYIDRTPDKTGGPQVNGTDPRVMEIWNLVFIQFNRAAGKDGKPGELTPLPSKHVDTGMGFERISQVLQDKSDNFAIDLWQPFFQTISQLSGQPYTGRFPATNEADPVAEAADKQLRTDIAFRVIADHARCLTFALTDGAVPSNEGRGYVLRRILRRAVRFGRQHLELKEPFLYKLVDTVADSMGDAFPELKKNPARVAELILDEEQSFGRTLDRGIALFEEAAVKGGKVVAASDAFKLHDTYGFPLDLTQIMAQERGMTVDVAGFEQLMEQAREQARSGGGQSTLDLSAKLVERVQKDSLSATTFVGYDRLSLTSTKVLQAYAVSDSGDLMPGQVTAGQSAVIVTDSTPFYGESGGQVGDHGRITASHGVEMIVSDTQKVGDVFFHIGKVQQGTIRLGDAVAMQVDAARRQAIMANHTSTHVMNHKLRAVLGEHVQQKGSLVDDQKLRFDFSHNAAMTEPQVEQVQQMVSSDIARNLPVHIEYAPQESALKIRGLRAVFGEKYPPKVRVVSIGVPVADLLANPDNANWYEYSQEFCGGTHLPSTGDAQAFVMIGEEAVGKGVRRITALTGAAAKQAIEQGDNLIRQVDLLAKAPAEKWHDGLAELTAAMSQATISLSAKSQIRHRITELQKQLKEHQKQQNQAAAGQAIDQARQIAETADDHLIVTEIPGADGDALRSAMDVIRAKKPQAAILLGSSTGPDKVFFVASVPPEVVKKGLKAGDWVRDVAKAAGGGGGGRPDMAQAGGKDASKLADALDVARQTAKNKLS